MTMDSPAPPNNPFSTIGNDNGDDDDSTENADALRNDKNDDFDAFSLYASAAGDGGGGASSSSSSGMPSLQSIQRQEQLMIMRQQQQQQQLPSFASLPSPDDENLSGPMDNIDATSNTNSNWPPPPPPASAAAGAAPPLSNAQEPSFLSNFLTCGIIPHLIPYFDIDTIDVYFRMKATFQYCLVNDGFRNEVLYSVVNTDEEHEDNNGVEMTNSSTPNEDASSASAEDASTSSGTTSPTTSTATTSSTHKKIGPDLYGPTWITLTLVFFVAVTSNMSLYLHHHYHRQVNLNDIVDEGGAAAEEEWEYDINQLLRATSILYSFSFGLPTVLYLLLRLMMGGNSRSSPASDLTLADLICLYGYSLVPYLPATWICIAPYDWVQWTMLGVATFLSGMLVLRNVVGSILSASRSRGDADVGGGGTQGKSGGLILCLVGCHLVFFVVMKLAFYHHHTA